MSEGSDLRAAWRADRARYPGAQKLFEPSFWAITSYRLGRHVRQSSGPLRRLSPLMGLVHAVVTFATGVSIPRSSGVGPGLKIFHYGGVFIHPDSTIGRNVTIGHEVTLGVREREDEVPHVGDDVVISAASKILGGVTVGDGAKIGAMSLVIRDVAPGDIVGGVPARVIVSAAAARGDGPADPAAA